MTSFTPANRIVGLKSGEDNSALTEATKYIALQLEADGDVVKSGADEQDFIGFQQNAPGLGDHVEIAGVGGGSKAIAAGTITAGDYCKTDANGHLVAMAAETANAVAFALDSAVDNDVFEVLVLAPGTSVIIA